MPNNMPYTQWYWDDWIAATVMLSPATRGIWVDLIGAMHRLDRVGAITGTVGQLARAGRCDVVEMETAIEELKAQNVADVTDRHGIVTIVCRRLKKEEKERTGNTLRKQKSRKKKDVTDQSHDCIGTHARNTQNQSQNKESISSEIPKKPPTQSEYPSSIEDVIEIASRPTCGMPIVRDQADGYLTNRLATDWIDGQRRKIPVSGVPYDLKKWLMRDQSEAKKGGGDANRKEFDF